MNEANVQQLFASPYHVSDSKIEFFRKNGYVQFDNVLNEDEVELLRTALGRASENKKGFVRDLAGGDGGGHEKILQMLNLWEYHPAVKDYLTGGRVAKMAAALSGSEEIRLYHDQALIKEPGPSAPSPWHQDQPYWPSKEGGMFSCWMALDHVTIERGCMQFIAGSQNWGEFEPVSFTGDGKELWNQLTDEQRELWNPVPVELTPGSCTFHHGLTFHYANANTTNQVRRAMVAIFIPDGITFAGDEKMDGPFSPTISSKKGEPLRGSKFIQLV